LTAFLGRPITRRMRHARLWLLLIGVFSLLAQAVGAAAVFGRGGLPRRAH
jgi:hypothetical protein